MSNSVDRRVVEMEFDNQQFEKRVSTTRESLKGLKNDLNFDETSKNLASLEKTANSMDLSGLTSGLDNISSKFSAMGAVGFTVLQNLTTSVISFGKKIASSTFGQITSGGKTRALNLEQAQFQISGLGVDWKKQTESGVSLYEQIDKAVSGTAYGLDAAAKVAGQLLASNIDAGTDKMQNALSGISGVAAMTNSTYEDIGQIFTTIAGNGRIMTEQLNQFAGRGLNVAATLAEHLHVTEAELRDMVSKGKVDFNTFAEAMNKAFGEQATKANDTYTGSLSNVKAALSRIGAEFQMPYLENMRQTFVALIPVLNSVKTSLGPMFEVATSGMEFFRKEIVDTLSKFAVFDKKGKTVSKDMNKFAEVVKNFVETLKAKDLTGRSVFDYLKVSYNAVKSIFGSLFKIVGDVVGPIKDAFTEMFPIHRVMQSLSNGLIAIKNFFSKFEAAIKSATASGDSLKRVASGIFAAFGLLVSVGKVLTKILGGLAIAAGKVLGWFLKLIAPVGNLIQNMHEFFVRTNGATNAIKPLVNAFKKLGGTLRSLIDTFQRAFNIALTPFKLAMKDNGKQTETFASIASNAIGKFVSFFEDKLSKLNEWLLAHRENIRKFGQTIGIVFGKIANNGFFKTAWNGLLNFCSKFADGFRSFRDGVAGTILSFGSIKTDGVTTLVEKFKDSTGPLEAIGKFFASLWALLKSVFSKISPILGSLIRTIFDCFTGITTIVKDTVDNLQPISGSSILSGGGVVALLITFMKNIKGIFNKLERFDPVQTVKKFSSLFDALFGYLDQLKKAKAAEALKDFATAVLEIAAAMLILASIDPERLVSALGAISVLIWELAEVFKIISNTGNTFTSFSLKGGFKKSTSNVSSIATALLQMAGSVLLLSLAIKVLDDMDPEQMILGLTAVSALLWELVGVVKVLSGKDKQQQMAKGAAVLIALSVAVRILANSVKKLGEMNPQQLLYGVSAVLALIFSMAAIMKILSDEESKYMIKASAAMVIMALALRIMAGAVKKFEKIEWESLAKAGTVLAAVVVVFKLFDKMKEAKLIKTATALVVMGAGLAALAIGLSMFNRVDWSGLAKAGVTLLGIFVALQLLSDIKPSDILKTATALVVMGAGLAALAIGLSMFNHVSVSGLVIGLTSLIAALIIMAVAAKKMEGSIASLYSLAGAVALFGLGVALLGTGLVAISMGITSLLGSLSALAKAFQFILVTILESIPMIFKIISAAIVAFLGIIRDAAPALGEALKAVIITALDTIIAIAPKIGEALVTLLDTFIPILISYIPKIGEALIVILDTLLPILVEFIPKIVDSIFSIIKKIIDTLSDRIPELGKSISNLINAIVQVFISIFSNLSSIDVPKFTEIATGLSQAVLYLSAGLLILSLVPLPAALLSVGGLSTLVAEVTAILIALGELTKIDGFEWLVKQGARILPIIGEAVGSFVGNLVGTLVEKIIGGVVDELLTFLPKFADSLSDFMNKLQPFLTGVLSITPQLVACVAELCGMIIMLSATDLITSVTNFFTGGISFVKFGKELCEFAPYMVRFGNIVAQTNVDSLAKSANAAYALARFASAVPNEGGLAAWFAGENSLAVFGPEMEKFGTNLANFSAAVDGKVNAKAVENAAKAGTAIAKMSKTIPNEGGVAAWFAGENSLSIYGPEMEEFGTNLANFSKAVEGNIDNEAISKAVKAAQSIAEMSKTIPNEGGVAAWFAGENSLAVFGPEMEKFAISLAGFSAAVDGKVNASAVKSASSAGKKIAEMTNSIPKEGGVLSWFGGDRSLSKFGQEMVGLGSGISGFSNAVSGRNHVGLKAVTDATEAGKKIAEMTKTIPTEKGLKGWIFGETSIANFSSKLKQLGSGISGFSNAVSGRNHVGLKAVTDATEAGTKIANMASTIPTTGGLEKIWSGEQSISNFSSQIVKFGKGIIAFSSAVSGQKINSAAVENVIDIGTKIVTMAKNIPAEGGLLSKLFGDKGLNQFCDGIKNFGTAMKSFSEELIDVNTDAMSKGIDSISELVEIAKSISESGSDALKDFSDGIKSLASVSVEEIVTKFTDSGPKIEKAIKDLLDGVRLGAQDEENQRKIIVGVRLVANYIINEAKKVIDNQKENFKTEGIALITNIEKGISSEKNDAIDAISNIISDMLKSLEKYEIRFRDIGTYYVSGIASGIRDNQYSAIDAATNVANGIKSATNNTLKINSPSKEGYNSGKFWDLGFAGGISAYAYAASDAAKQNSQGVINTTQDLLSALVNINLDDISPTIRPVLDLSNVSNGVNDISGMFNSIGSINAGKINIDSPGLSKSMDQKRMDSSNDRIVNAIQNLTDRIDNLEASIINRPIELDGTTVSKKLASKMDKELGQRRMYSRRGI